MKVFVNPPVAPSNVKEGAVTSPVNWNVVPAKRFVAVPTTLPVIFPTIFPTRLP